MKPIQVMIATVGTKPASASADSLQRRAVEALKAAGVEIVHEREVALEGKLVQGLLQRYANDLDAIILLGGEGAKRTDTVPEVVRKLSEQELPGFGESFRAAVLKQQGPGVALVSRAVAGIFSGCVVFVLPHSDEGVDLGVGSLIVPALGPLVAALRTT